MPIEILENIIIDDSQNLNLTGSAIFTGSVDVGGLTVNGAPVTGDVDLSGYDTSVEVDNKLSNYDTSTEVDAKIAAIPSTDLSGYDTSTQVDSKISSSLTDYYTSTQVDSRIVSNLTSYDTSIQVDNKISLTLTNYDTSIQVNDKISTSLSSYDTSSQVDTKIANLVDSAPETLNTLGELATALSGNDTAIDGILATLATKADSSSIPTNNNQLTNGAGYITSPDGGNAATLGGVSASVAATNSTIVQRHSSGYIFANYFNTTPNDVTSGVTKVCVETSNDGYIRHGTAAAVRSFLNVADNANYITNNNQLTNGANYITSASVGNGTITITQPGASNQTFTVNQSGNTTIALRNDNTDTNTTYSAASNGGLTLDGTQFKINVENLNPLPQ